MGLDTYRRKRDFQKTPEPKGARRAKRSKERSFVIQKHAASRMHHDFRLELDGVLKSWAVPKGPPLEPRAQALAVEVEDHPLEYGSFEGVIPKGEYGGGTVMLFDRGTWEPEGDARKALSDGKLTFRLDGERLRGRWSLVRMADRPGDKKHNWLLIKRTDGAGDKSAMPAGETRSVSSGRTMKEIANEADRVWSSKKGELAKGARDKEGKKAVALDPGAVPGAKRARLSGDTQPQLATLVASAPDGDEWLNEVKYDGYRLLAIKDGARVCLRTRGRKDWTDRFPTVARAIAGLGVGRAIVDGEVVVLGADGTSSFQALQNSLDRRASAEHVYFAFDLPYCDGFDLTASPLIERKNLLARLLAVSPTRGVVRYSEHVAGRGADFFRAACELGLEGIIAKRADARYEQRRSRTWLKIKCVRRQEFVIGAWSDPQGTRSHFGALLLGVYEDDGLHYCGKVGTGFDQRSLAALSARLAKLAADEPPFVDPPKGREARAAHWVRPELVCEVSFAEWTSDGSVRHPSFQGLREDKDARSVRREMPKKNAEAAAGPGKRKPPAAPTRAGASSARKKGEAVVAGVRLSNPGRILWPEDAITKEELAAYYVAVAGRMIPEIAGRPLTLMRCPRGYREACFYQRHVHESAPPSVRGVPVEEKGERRTYLAVDDLTGLLSLVQLDVLEFHVWGSRADRLEYPDRIVIDLDPDPSVPWPKVVATAHAVREQLEALDLQAFARTTGGKGLHVVVPIERRTPWEEVKGFARDLSAAVARREPALYVLTATKAKRKGKIYLDYLRNARTASAIASYSTRARAGAPVATPIRWEELEPALDPAKFTLRTVPERLKKLRADPWRGFADIRQKLTKRVLEKLRRRS
jgi:bifunctional non-homologous end joining protein LigD